MCSNSQFLVELANAVLSNGGPLSDMTLSEIPWHAKIAITGPAFVLLSRMTSGNLE